jgi:hypothetical protein
MVDVAMVLLGGAELAAVLAAQWARAATLPRSCQPLQLSLSLYLSPSRPNRTPQCVAGRFTGLCKAAGERGAKGSRGRAPAPGTTAGERPLGWSATAWSASTAPLPLSANRQERQTGKHRKRGKRELKLGLTNLRGGQGLLGRACCRCRTGPASTALIAAPTAPQQHPQQHAQQHPQQQHPPSS